MKRFLMNWILSSLFTTLAISVPTSVYGIFTGKFSSISVFFLFFTHSTLYVGKFALICFFIGSFFISKKQRENKANSNLKYGYKWELLLNVKEIENLAKKELDGEILKKTTDLCENFYHTVPRLNLLFKSQRKNDLTKIVKEDLTKMVQFYSSLENPERDKNKELVLESLTIIEKNLSELKKK